MVFLWFSYVKLPEGTMFEEFLDAADPNFNTKALVATAQGILQLDVDLRTIEGTLRGQAGWECSIFIGISYWINGKI